MPLSVAVPLTRRWSTEDTVGMPAKDRDRSSSRRVDCCEPAVQPLRFLGKSADMMPLSVGIVCRS